MKVYLRFFAAWGCVAVVVALVVILIVSCINRIKTTDNDAIATEQTASEEINEDLQTPAEAEQQTGAEQKTADDEQTTEELQTREPEYQTEAQVIHGLVNETIDLDGLDGERTGWWFGGEEDEYGRSLHVLQMQEEYGHLSMNGIMPWEPGDPKVIYLTMDEGYEAGYTPSILDTLKSKNVPCTFFLTLPYAEEEPELVQRMIDEGHQLGNHSVYHPEAMPEETIEEQIYEVMGVHDYIQEHFDYTMHLFRFPAGRYSEKSLAIVNNCNYRSIFWSYAYGDYDENDQPDPAGSLSAALSYLHPGAIYLLHAISSTNNTILGDFIDGVRAAGYDFAVLP